MIRPSSTTRQFGTSRPAPTRAPAGTPPTSVPGTRRMFGGAQGTPAPYPTSDEARSIQPLLDAAGVTAGEAPCVGNYQIIGHLGTGGMAEVYIGLHPVLNRKVAIKVLRSDLVHDGTIRRRFLQEARIIDRLRHRNIPDLVDVGQMLDGRLYLVMEFLEGETLASRLEKGPLEPLESISILRQVCAGLQAAHEVGIYHRDLKPDNIFLAHGNDLGLAAGSAPCLPRHPGELHVKILDWGVARVIDQLAPRLTSDGLVVGTPLYIAPEQARGLPADGRSDIYALGAVAYEMFLQTPPFTGNNGLEIVYRHIRDVPIMPRVLWPEIPPLLESLVLGMLAKVPELRPSLDLVCDALAATDAELRKRHGDAAAAPLCDQVPGDLTPSMEMTTAEPDQFLDGGDDDLAYPTDTWIQIVLAPADDDIDVVMVAPVSALAGLRHQPGRNGDLTRVLDELYAETGV